MTDMMVDTETMGNQNPEIFGCFQVAAIKFNAKTGEIGGTFDRCPAPLPNRHWTEDTQDFWMRKNRSVYDTLVARQEPGERVWQDFRAFALDGSPSGGYRFWAKPLTFDWPVVASNLRQLGMDMPFHYRYARDMNSYIAGLRGDPEHFPTEKLVEFTGNVHNALHDCAFQIDCLMHVVNRHVKAEIIQ